MLVSSNLWKTKRESNVWELIWKKMPKYTVKYPYSFIEKLVNRVFNNPLTIIRDAGYPLPLLWNTILIGQLHLSDSIDVINSSSSTEHKPWRRLPSAGIRNTLGIGQLCFQSQLTLPISHINYYNHVFNSQGICVWIRQYTGQLSRKGIVVIDVQSMTYRKKRKVAA